MFDLWTTIIAIDAAIAKRIPVAQFAPLYVALSDYDAIQCTIALTNMLDIMLNTLEQLSDFEEERAAWAERCEFAALVIKELAV